VSFVGASRILGWGCQLPDGQLSSVFRQTFEDRDFTEGFLRLYEYGAAHQAPDSEKTKPGSAGAQPGLCRYTERVTCRFSDSTACLDVDHTFKR